jgi:hypothetical protein
LAVFFTNVGPKRGPFLHRDVGGAAIGVLESRANNMPIGMALGARWDPDGIALWRLTVRGEDLPGLWVVVDREFRPAGSE